MRAKRARAHRRNACVSTDIRRFQNNLIILRKGVMTKDEQKDKRNAGKPVFMHGVIAVRLWNRSRNR